MNSAYRVYFNRDADWPMIWCVDEGDISTQIRCHYVDLTGAYSIHGGTILVPGKIKKVPNEPLAWLDVVGVLSVSGGIARFRGVSK